MNTPTFDFHLDLLQWLLVVAIVIIAGMAGFFLLATFIKRAVKIRENKIKKIYQKEIDELLFKFLFDKNGELTSNPVFLANKKSALFQKLFIKSIIALHYNYSGVYSQKLEKFYVDSGLVHYSLKKLQSKNWSLVVEGMRDLSSLKYQPAYIKLKYLEFGKNKFVQQEILLARIRLRGLKDLFEFQHSKFFLNDWNQSNILFLVKKHNLPAPENLSELLKATNQSVVLLAVRLIQYYKQVHHGDALMEVYKKTKEHSLKKEIELVLNSATLF